MIRTRISRASTGRVRGVVALIQNPIVQAQVALVSISLLQLAVLSRLFPAHFFGLFTIAAALWSISAAAIGSSLSTRALKESANTGSPVLHIANSDLHQLVGCAVLVLIISIVSGFPLLDAVLVTAAVLTLIATEVICAIALGRGFRRRYGGLLIIRSLGPLAAVSIEYISFGHASLTAALFGALVANAAVCLVGRDVRILWGTTPELTAVGIVGAINLGLWVLAAGDRVILGLRMDPSGLATYGLITGLLDRAFRTPTNAYISSVLPQAFMGHSQARRHEFQLAITLLAFLAIPGGLIAIDMISGGKYHATPLLVATVTVGLATLSASSPLYVDATALGLLRPLRRAMISMVVVFITLSWVLTPYWGPQGVAIIKMFCYGSWAFMLCVITSVGDE